MSKFLHIFAASFNLTTDDLYITIMKTTQDINLYLSVHSNLEVEGAKEIENLRHLLETSPDDFPKIFRGLNLPNDFLEWFDYDYTPSRFAPVYFTDSSKSYVGIIRNINPRTGEIIFYCAFCYETLELDLGNFSASSGWFMGEATVSEYNRLENELKKVGLVWKKGLNRLEPIDFVSEKGSTYWYIDDKLRIITATEQINKTSHLRYLAGNYFTDYGRALEICDKIRELLKENVSEIGRNVK